MCTTKKNLKNSEISYISVGTKGLANACEN